MTTTDYTSSHHTTPDYTSSHHTTPEYNSPLSDAVMDALNMPSIPDQCFNLIIDKALLDAQLCTPHNIDNASALVQEMYRVLAPGDTFY
jgi:ubiquinone/menaquinone biosynthesis C-methylase UbiE